jgi:phytanoyl-CoA hydroxylase
MKSHTSSTEHTDETHRSPAWQGEKRQFDRDGHVHLRGALPAADQQVLAGAVERYCREVLPALPASEAFYEIKSRPDTLKQAANLHLHDPVFAALLADQRLVGLAEALLAGAVVGVQVILFAKAPGISAPTPPHQDAIFSMLDTHQAVNLWIALDAVDSANGGVRFVNGSHRRGLRPHRRSGVLGFSQDIPDFSARDRAQEVGYRLLPGDLVAHHALTIHRAEPNPGPRQRRGVSLTYYCALAKRDEERAARYRLALLDELARANLI